MNIQSISVIPSDIKPICFMLLQHSTYTVITALRASISQQTMTYDDSEMGEKSHCICTQTYHGKTNFPANISSFTVYQSGAKK